MYSRDAGSDPWAKRCDLARYHHGLRAVSDTYPHHRHSLNSLHFEIATMHLPERPDLSQCIHLSSLRRCSARQPYNQAKAHMNRYTNMLARLLLALLLATIGMPALAVAQETPRPELSAETLIETARAALAKGELEDAEFLLKGIKPGEGNIDDLDFLYGSIAMAREDWQAAIARFRAMLIRDPTLPRVRLDLALAYFRAEEDSSAAYHFRQVLGDEDLPPVVRARTLAFLDTIRRRKTWSVSAAVALAPDSNINAATSSREVNLFGLPAQLSEDARQTSGVGLNARISGDTRRASLRI